MVSHAPAHAGAERPGKSANIKPSPARLVVMRLHASSGSSATPEHRARPCTATNHDGDERGRDHREQRKGVLARVAAVGEADRQEARRR